MGGRLGRLRSDVEALAAMRRDSAGPGERESAEWLAGRLREMGAEEVRLEPFRWQTSWAPAHALHFAAGAAAALAGHRLLVGAALASFELEYTGRTRWLRRLLPTGEGTNVTARLPARGTRRRTLVLVAHHDAARTGLAWHPALLRAGDARAERTGRRSSLALLPELCLLAAALGGPSLRPIAAAGLLANVGLALQVTRGQVVPGANDNATGVAAVLALAERLADERPAGTEVMILAPGCEESGMGGMGAWLGSSGAGLDPESTLVLGLDTVGSGTPVVLEAEGGLWPVRYRPQDVALADEAAALAGVGVRRWRLGAWTDPVLARLAGLPAISLLSVRDGGFPNYHRPTDTPDRVDWASVERCLELAHATVRHW